MRIAYLILAHSNPNQLKRLVNSLDNENAAFFIHIDKNVINIHDYFMAGLHENIHFIKQRVFTKWGGFSVVQATLNSLEEILSYNDYYDYVCLLSGSDYPIKRNEYIFDFFAANKGKEFLYCEKIPTFNLPNGGVERIEYYYDCDNKVTTANTYEYEMRKRNIKRRYICGLIPYQGFQWWSFSSECICYILNYVRENKEIVNFYRYTRYPDEQFFQTIIMNSGFANNAVNDSLRYIDWSSVDFSTINWEVNPPHPKTLTAADLLPLLQSNKLYARKFDQNVDTIILDTFDKIFRSCT